MAVDIQSMIIQQYMKELFKDPKESEAKTLQLESLKASITPLTNYETNFSNKWKRTVTGSETVDELNALKTSNKNLYDSMTKNMSPEKKIPMTDSYTANDLKIDKQIELVGSYDSYKTKIDSLYGELETALLHNAKTLDQLGGVYAEGFENWEDIYSTGTSAQVEDFRKNVSPLLEENGENISLIMQKIVSSQKELAKYEKFSGVQYVARDVDLLRNIASNLGTELKTTTFLTDKEAKGLLDGWVNKDMSSYLSIKGEQSKESKLVLDELKARKKVMVKREAELNSRLRVMAGSEQPDIDMELGASKETLATERARLRNDIKKIDIQMLRTGEIGASTGLGGNIELSPVSPAAIEAEKAGTLGIKVPSKDISKQDATWDMNIHGKDSTPAQRKKNRMQTYKMNDATYNSTLDAYREGDESGKAFDITFDAFLEKNKDNITRDYSGASGDEVDDKFVAPDINTLIDSYSKAYTKSGMGAGFNRTEVGNKFMKENSLNTNIMTKLAEIESAKIVDPKGDSPHTQNIIDKNKKEIISLFEDAKVKNLDKIARKARDYIKPYAKGNKIPPDKIAIIKKAYPKIDEYITEWKEYGSGQFLVWLRKRIDKGKAEEIDYSKFKGIL